MVTEQPFPAHSRELSQFQEGRLFPLESHRHTISHPQRPLHRFGLRAGFASDPLAHWEIRLCVFRSDPFGEAASLRYRLLGEWVTELPRGRKAPIRR
jgi:hypothetical protein